MRIDFSQTFVDLEGEVIERPHKDGANVPVTLGYLCGTAMMSADPQKPESAEDKVRCYDVAVRVYKGGEQDVSAEDITLIKRKVGESMTAIVVGQAVKMLEQQQ